MIGMSLDPARSTFLEEQAILADNPERADMHRNGVNMAYFDKLDAEAAKAARKQRRAA